MKPLNSSYATFFNKKYNRRGYLFQDRFKSIASQDQGYIEEMVRYVHLNPVRAGICKSIDLLDRYPWCGHSAIMGYVERKFQDTRSILQRFGAADNDARRKYRQFIAEGMADTLNETQQSIRKNMHGGWSRNEPARWVIGDPEFVRAAFENDRANRLGVSKNVRTGITLDTIAQRCSRTMGIALKMLFKKSRNSPSSDARKLFAYLSKQKGLSIAEIARYLSVDGSAVCRMAAKGEGIAVKSAQKEKN
jgi:hypothetical protein